MECPIDGERLVMADRNGVEIDYCPKCRGVWLDRGELDKIIERATGAGGRDRDSGRKDDRREDRRDDHRDDRYRDDERRQYGDDDRGRPGKRRESFLSDLFDF